MKTIGITFALAFIFSVVPVMAEESFKGMQNLSITLEALSDAELAKVEGGQELTINLTHINANRMTANATAISAAVAGDGGTATSGAATASATNAAPTLTNTADITATFAAPPATP